jgi:hypothetical protein
MRRHGENVRPFKPIACQRGRPAVTRQRRTNPVLTNTLDHLVVCHVARIGDATLCCIYIDHIPATTTRPSPGLAPNISELLATPPAPPVLFEPVPLRDDAAK